MEHARSRSIDLLALLKQPYALTHTHLLLHRPFSGMGNECYPLEYSHTVRLESSHYSRGFRKLSYVLLYAGSMHVRADLGLPILVYDADVKGRPLEYSLCRTNRIYFLIDVPELLFS